MKICEERDRLKEACAWAILKYVASDSGTRLAGAVGTPQEFKTACESEEAAEKREREYGRLLLQHREHHGC